MSVSSRAERADQEPVWHYSDGLLELDEHRERDAGLRFDQVRRPSGNDLVRRNRLERIVRPVVAVGRRDASGSREVRHARMTVHELGPERAELTGHVVTGP